jgi:nucleoside-diphosphate-sugar epimerase
MKVALVDGALGHSASFLIKLLNEKGWKVIATDLEETKRVNLMTKEKIFDIELKKLDCRDWDNVTYIPADLTEKDSLYILFSQKNFPENVTQYDAIFHTASLYDYGAPYELLHEVNYNGLKNLLNVLKEDVEKKNSIYPRFIHWSTLGVYGEPEYKEDKKGFIFPADENTPYNPPNNYSKTKVEQENLIMKFKEENPTFHHSILRPAPIYGPFQTYGMFHIFYTSYIAGHMILSKVIPKKRKLMMPFIHVKDLAKAALFIAECDKCENEAYNVINDSPLQEKWQEYVFNELGISFSIVPIPWFMYKIFAKFELELAKMKVKKANTQGYRPKFDIPMVEYITHQYYFSNKKLKDLGFQFEYNDFRKGVRETIRWYMDHGWLPSYSPRKPNFIHDEPSNDQNDNSFILSRKKGEI